MQKKGQFWSQKTSACEIMCGSRKRSSYKNLQSPICCSLIKITAWEADKKGLLAYWPWEQERGKVWYDNVCNFTSEKSFSVSDAHQQKMSAKFCSWMVVSGSGHGSVLRKAHDGTCSTGWTSRESKAGSQMGSNSLPSSKRGVGIGKKV